MIRGVRAKRRKAQVSKMANKPYSCTIPNNIRAWRGKRGLSQQELSIILGVSRVTISYWETGEKSPKDRNKLALCKALNCTISDLFDWGV